MLKDQTAKYVLTLNSFGQIVPESQAEWLGGLAEQEWLTLPEASIMLGISTHQIYARRYLVPQYVLKTEDGNWVLHRKALKDPEAVHKLTIAHDKHHNRRARKVFCVELNKTFRTMREAATAVGVSDPTVRMSARHGTRCRAGYTFHYV